MTNSKGILIGFEGGEGCGKTTQFKLVQDYLIKEKGFDVFSFREPGSTKIGEQIRGILLNPANEEMTPDTEFFLYSAARSQTFAEIVRPQLESNRIVLADRSFYSSLVYQGFAGNVDPAFIKLASTRAMGGIMHDLMFLLDVDVICGLSRAGGRGGADRVESKGLEYHKKVNEAYKQCAREDSKTWRVIPSLDGKINEMQTQIRKEIDLYLEQRGTSDLLRKS